MTTVLPEGFKEECEEIAIETRRELGSDCENRFDPWGLAEWLHIDVDSIECFCASDNRDVRRLTKFDQDGFSAATAFCTPKARILFNPAHPPARQRESVAHELGHVLLEHKPTWPPFDQEGKRYSREQEEAEAEYMAAALLVPAPAVAPVLAHYSGDVGAAADHFGVRICRMEQRIAECCPPSSLAVEAEVAATVLAEQGHEGAHAPAKGARAGT
jgi:hypothetical protein